jgi:flagellin-specific chaperone FliS
MKKAELVAQLEGAKALTSVVSIDNVIALIQQLEEAQAVKTESRITAKLFDKIVDTVEDAINGMRTSHAVDLSSAEFELDWNNCINLTDISLDTDYIYNEIREGLENAFDIDDVDEDEDIEAQIEAEQPASEE